MSEVWSYHEGVNKGQGGQMSQHRWSGWPGAWCLDCGTADMSEESIDCLTCLQGDTCPEHVQKSCPSPGEALHDPYKEKAKQS